MAISQVAVGAGATPVSGGDITVAYPAGIQVDDVLILHLVARDNVVVSLPAEWTIKAAHNNGSALRQTIAWSRYTGSGTSVLVSHNVGSNVITGRIIAFRGVIASGDPFEAFAGPSNYGSATSGTRTLPTVTTVTAGARLLYFIGAADDYATAFAVANAQGLTVTEWDDRETTTGLDLSLAAYHAEKATAGSQTGIGVSVTLSSSQVGVGWAGALKPAQGQAASGIASVTGGGAVTGIGQHTALTVATASGGGLVTVVGSGPKTVQGPIAVTGGGNLATTGIAGPSVGLGIAGGGSATVSVRKNAVALSAGGGGYPMPTLFPSESLLPGQQDTAPFISGGGTVTVTPFVVSVTHEKAGTAKIGETGAQYAKATIALTLQVAGGTGEHVSSETATAVSQTHAGADAAGAVAKTGESFSGRAASGSKEHQAAVGQTYTKAGTGTAAFSTLADGSLTGQRTGVSASVLVGSGQSVIARGWAKTGVAVSNAGALGASFKESISNTHTKTGLGFSPRVITAGRAADYAETARGVSQRAAGSARNSITGRAGYGSSNWTGSGADAATTGHSGTALATASVTVSRSVGPAVPRWLITPSARWDVDPADRWELVR